MADGSRALDRLLGCDTDAYVEQHMDKYEQAMSRWRNCSMEEWEAGADGAFFACSPGGEVYPCWTAELTARYTKIIDFVSFHCLFSFVGLCSCTLNR